jgi:hypothetical protein
METIYDHPDVACPVCKRIIDAAPFFDGDADPYTPSQFLLCHCGTKVRLSRYFTFGIEVAQPGDDPNEEESP